TTTSKSPGTVSSDSNKYYLRSSTASSSAPSKRKAEVQDADDAASPVTKRAKHSKQKAAVSKPTKLVKQRAAKPHLAQQTSSSSSAQQLKGNSRTEFIERLKSMLIREV